MKALIPATLIALVLGCNAADDAQIAPTSPATTRALDQNSSQRPYLMKGMQLGPEERSKIFLINRRYNEKIAEIRAHLSNPNAPLDAITVRKVHALRAAQLGEMRAAMSVNNAIKFDQNRQLVDAKLAEIRALHGISR